MTFFHGDRDAAVRSTLASRGDDGRTPRHTLFYFYGGDVRGLESAALQTGYTAHPTAGRDGLVLETTTAVDEENFEIHHERMEAWAEQFGCDYDGWECQLLVQ